MEGNYEGLNNKIKILNERRVHIPGLNNKRKE